MSHEDLPLKLKILTALGLAKVKITERKTEDLQTGFSDYKPRKKFNYSKLIVPVGIIIPILLTGFSIISPDSEDDKETPLREQVLVVAENEDKMEWQQEDWTNDDVEEKLRVLANEIDRSNCSTLEDMFIKNESWTLRAYVAHTLLEKGCL